MTPPAWPLYGLRIRTPRLELRLPDDALLSDLASVAADGVHAPEEAREVEVSVEGLDECRELFG